MQIVALVQKERFETPVQRRRNVYIWSLSLLLVREGMKRKERHLCTVFILVLFLTAPLVVPSLTTARTLFPPDEIVHEKRTVGSDGSFSYNFCIGRINNLTTDYKFFYFESDNMHWLTVFKRSSGSWGISYVHYNTGFRFYVSGFDFRGILKPFFICGVFYATWY